MSGGPGRGMGPDHTFATGNPHTDIDFFTQDGETLPLRRDARASVPTPAGRRSCGSPRTARSPRASSQPIRRRAASATRARARPPARRRGDAEGRRPAQHPQPLRRRRRHPAPARRHRCPRAAATTREPRPSPGPPGRARDHRRQRPANPVEIALTSHTGEAHTVNVDPKRPHIAYVVQLRQPSASTRTARSNEDPRASEPRPRRLRGGRPVAAA